MLIFKKRGVFFQKKIIKSVILIEGYNALTYMLFNKQKDLINNDN